MQRRTFIGALATMAAFSAFAQKAFPSKPITIIVPYAGGSSSDAQARIFADHLSKTLGQSVVVKNKPGANGALGMQALKAAPADGYTIGLAGGSPMVINPFVTKNLSYDPHDFIHIHGIAIAPAAFVVGSNSPYQSLADAVAIATAEKRPLNIGTYAAIYELGVTALALDANCAAENISYKGAGNVITDLIGGHLEIGFIDISGAITLIEEGQLRILGLASSTRPEAFSQAPIVSDTYSGFEITPWTSFIIRKETQQQTANEIEAALSKVAESPSITAYLESNGLIPMKLGREQMQSWQELEVARYRKLTGVAHIKPK
ncbi:Bug family tripartite tricarboxylate transporter substrate binding protein [Allopusillimonas ginsengisoli]|uniref:Bug family tripartite tricarboxylate transporter substrate binding protein n=1 Tax=Allopusillimonas ginsengisoli TaxID=453575 RepID=UPI001021EA7D|nr:tripartite tricarboxylate transporter substrate binding protein [Allopusillimonas ginsengisoli]TEA76916.1 tripartite tricarboxylate transporter substrate binding protein [Allopusillimonas ginsengisoli]